MRRAAPAVLLTITALGLVACAQTGVRAEDAYAVGCPAVDSAVAGGQIAGQATAAGLDALSESGQLGPEPQRWVDAAVDLLRADDPAATPSEAKRLIIDGCADNGYALRNLS